MLFSVSCIFLFIILLTKFSWFRGSNYSNEKNLKSENLKQLFYNYKVEISMTDNNHIYHVPMNFGLVWILSEFLSQKR